MLAETMHAELRDAVLTEIKAAGRSWQEMPEGEQALIIERIDQRVESVLARAVATLVAHEFAVVEGMLEQVTVKDDLKAVIKVARNAPDRFDLIDTVGARVRVVVADHREFMGAPGEVQPDADQPDLPLATVGDGDPLVEAD